MEDLELSIISVKNLSFSYDDGYKEIFNDISFTIDSTWKLGLIGRNGRGKTTFLKLLMGEYEYSGSITSNLSFTYFPYEIKNESVDTIDILNKLNPDIEDWKIYKELSLLDVDLSVLYRPFSSLSAGEKTKVLLASLFLNENNFMLIDEPTNHLDVDARRKVADYLRSKKGFILISHDRKFLDNCTDHILSINKNDIMIVNGNYSVFKENFDNKMSFENTQNEKLLKEIDKLQIASARTSSWANKTEASKYGKASSGLKQDKGYVGHKAAKLMKRAKAIEKRSLDAIEQKKQLLRNLEYASSLNLSPLEYHSKKLISFNKFAIVYDNQPIFSPISFDIETGDRIALNGINGCGKSSVLKFITGNNISFNGDAKLGSNLIISYVPQSVDNVKGDIYEYAKSNSIDPTLFMTILFKLGFDRIDFDSDISSLSFGQKKKILIAKSLCEKAHLYIYMG